MSAATLNLDVLEEAALAATPGPWTYFPKQKYNEHHVSLPIEGAGMRRALFDDGCQTDRPEQDAKFIAAANPAVVLELIERVQVAEERANMDMPAVTQCPACFRVFDARLGIDEPADQRTPIVDAFMERWTDDGATREAAFMELRDLARELERRLRDRHQDVVRTEEARLTAQADAEHYRKLSNELRKQQMVAAGQPPSADDVEWIVNDMGELGVRVRGRCYFCYKGDSLVYKEGKHDNGEPILHRNVGKREFGETVWPMKWIKDGRSEHRYTLELVYTPGLSFGPPDDPKHKWLPLPVEVPDAHS